MDAIVRTVNRRDFVKTVTLAGLGLGALGVPAAEAPGAKRKFTLCLACGLIGISSDPQKVIGWASQFGFEAIEPSAQFLGKLSDSALQAYLGEVKTKNLTWGAAGLSLDFRGTDTAFEQSLKSLPEFARSLQRAGVTTGCYGVYLGDRPLRDGPIQVLPLHAFLRELGSGRVLAAARRR